MLTLGLGTAHFGRDYGLAARRSTFEDVEEILSLAASAGVRVVDTAAQYGAAEQLLGRAMPATESFDIVSKTPSWRRDGGGDPAQWVVDAARRSLERLQQPRMYGYLVHHADELLGNDGPALWQGMERVRSLGLAQKVGVSAYDGDQIDAALARYSLNLVQLPLNVLDHRLVAGGQLQRLGDRGVEIHARSVFLQGVLLSQPASIPARLASLRTSVQQFRDACNDVAPQTAALGFIRACPQVAVAVVGVSTATELGEIVAAFHAPPPAMDYQAFALEDGNLLNPGLWPKENA